MPAPVLAVFQAAAADQPAAEAVIDTPSPGFWNSLAQPSPWAEKLADFLPNLLSAAMVL